MYTARFLPDVGSTGALLVRKRPTENRVRPTAMPCALQRTVALEAEIRELEAFVHSVSHELRAPLRAIDGFAKLLLEHCDERIGEPAQHYLTCIVTAERRMAELIDALLSLSRLAHADIQRSEIDMRDLISQILADLQRHEPPRKIEVTIEQLPPIHGDPVLIRQVFENLLTNALKYTRRRPIARIHVGCSATPDEIVFFVRDNGAGFDMRRAGRLFSPFERLHAAHEFEGIGVGLALVRRIVERHGGRVWAEAACRIGATLHVAIPHRGYDNVAPPSDCEVRGEVRLASGKGQDP
jgi:light-regulated signal transduction histidine kinase (bacteriophytochrome)